MLYIIKRTNTRHITHPF